MSSAKFCGHCGSPVQTQARFCTNCGARVGSATTTPGMALATTSSTTPTTAASNGQSATTAPTTVGNGRYRIERQLGRGGMSTVYLACDERNVGRKVAIKEMTDTFATPQERAEAENDFAREADLLASLRHPAIPAIIDRFSERNKHLLVMEYITGQSLETMLLVHGPYDEDQVKEWALALCPVLSYLHAQEPPVVFRDLKPANIMIEPDGRVRLIDFGIARLFKPQQKKDTVALGTSGYASPEHYTGQTDARSDIFSLGATLHHLLTGRDPSKNPPFAFPPVRQLVPGISAEFAAVIDRAVRSDPDKRFASIDEMQKAIEGKRRKFAPATPAPASAPRLPRDVTPPFAPMSRPVPPPAAAARSLMPVPSTPSAPVSTLAPKHAQSQILVLDAANPSRRIDVVAVSGLVSSLTGIDEGPLRARLQRGLPLTLALPTHPSRPAVSHLSSHPGLANLGVVARVVTPSLVPVLLNQELRQRLNTMRQLTVRDVTVGVDRTCRCRRCNYVWKTSKTTGEAVPRRCPNCRSTDWGRWRIFKCAWCGHEFDTADITTQAVESIFPTCPCCGLPNWETGRPPDRSGWIDRLIAAITSTP